MESEKKTAKKSETNTTARRESPAPLFAHSRDFPLRRLQRSLGNDAVANMLRTGGVQAKLAVSQSGDAYEQEADRVADLFTNMRGISSVLSSPLVLQRKCSACSAGARCPNCEKEEEEKEKLRTQRKPSSSVTRNDSVPDDFLSSLGSGLDLDLSLRESLESRFGHDFGGVRIHTGSRATQSARAINALAYTRGRDIVFGEGQFAPETPAGLRLLAHELTHVVQQGAQNRAPIPPTIQRKEPDQAQKESSRVSLLTISCADKVIQFSTVAGNFSYKLTSCDLDEGDYQANVTVAGKKVTFDLGIAAPKGTRFHFEFSVEPFQMNPATFFQGQKTVEVIATNLSLQPKSEDTRPEQATAKTESAPLEHFKRLVRNAGKVRLEANRFALEEWRTFLQQKLTPQQVRAQAQAQETLEVMGPAVHGGAMEMATLERWLQASGPNQRWVLKQQIEGRYRACTGCHAMVRAQDMDRMLEERFGPYQTPLQQEREASRNAPAPVPDFAKKEAGVPQWAQVSPSAFPAVSEALANLEAIRPFFQVLGSKGYRVLPDEVLGSTASAREILEQINKHIDQRQADLLELERKIDEPDFDYLELRPIVKQFLPAADPGVRAAVEEEIANAEDWETVKEIVVGAATIATLLLIVFPPTTALGMLGATALGAGMGAYQVYSGIESFEQGRMYALSRGTKGVFDPAQQEAADMLMTMGVLNSVMGGIAVGTSALGAVKIIRSGGPTPGGSLGAIQSVEAQAGENSVRITGLDTPTPQARITGPNGEVIYEGPAELAGVRGKPGPDIVQPEGSSGAAAKPPLKEIQGGGQSTLPRRGHLSLVGKQGAPPPPAAAAERASQVSAVEDEAQLAGQQPLSKAVGDPATENAGPTMRRQGTAAQASAGGRGTRSTTGTGRSGGTQSQTTTPPAGGTRASGGPRRLSNPPVDAVPEPHPLLPRGLANYSDEEILDFFRTNKGRYPSEIQKMIDDIPPEGMNKTALRNRLEGIDSEIRDLHTQEANRLAGRANAAEKPFVKSVRGASNEGGKFSSLVTDEKQLTLVGQLKSGGTVEFDSVQFTRNRIVETKMNLSWKTQADVSDQMMHQAAFARDWGFGEVRWEVWDSEGLGMARRALNDLESLHPDLASRISVVNPSAAH